MPFATPKLGGFLGMSAFAKGQLVGDEVTQAQLEVERIIGSFPIGRRGDMRLGLVLAATCRGEAYTETKRTWVLSPTTPYVGGVARLGPP